MTKTKSIAESLLPTHARLLLQRTAQLAAGLAQHASEISPKYAPLLDTAEILQTSTAVAQALQVQQEAVAVKRTLSQQAKELLAAEVAAVKTQLSGSATRLAEIETAMATHTAALKELRAERKQLRIAAKDVQLQRIQGLKDRSQAELASKVQTATAATAALRASYEQLGRQYQELLNLAEANFALTQNSAAVADLKLPPQSSATPAVAAPVAAESATPAVAPMAATSSTATPATEPVA